METRSSVNKEIEPWDKEYDADYDDEFSDENNNNTLCEKGSFQEDKLEEEEKSQHDVDDVVELDDVDDVDDVVDVDKINNEKPIRNVVMSLKDIIIWYCLNPHCFFYELYDSITTFSWKFKI